MMKVKHIQNVILRIKATAVNSHYSCILPNTRTSYSLFPASDPKFPLCTSAFAGRFLTCYAVALCVAAMCALSDNIYDYPTVSQGKLTIPNVDDGEELELTDVSKLDPCLLVNSFSHR